MRVLITGGGTGGHTLAAVAVADALADICRDSGQPLELLYAGSANGLEARVAPERGLQFVSIAAGKLRRARSIIGLLSLANAVDAFRVPLGFFQSLGVVRRFGPQVVVSTGGYVSVPVVLAAGLQKIPVMMHEQTVQIGLANRICARFATRIALSYAGSEADLAPRLRNRCFVSGSVVRAEVLGGNKQRGAQFAGFRDEDGDLPVVYITGGAQGSRLINRSVEQCLGPLLDISRVIHQCGKQPTGMNQDEDALRTKARSLPECKQDRYYVSQFIGSEIADVLALADLIAGRSGAGTVGEVCAVGKPALYIPLVPTGGDEQTRNALRVREAGGAEILPQADLNGESLYAAISRMLANKSALIHMGANALYLFKPGAANALAQAAIEVASPYPKDSSGASELSST